MTTKHHPRSTRRPLLMLLALLAFTLTTLLGQPTHTDPAQRLMALAGSSSPSAPAGSSASAPRSTRTTTARTVQTRAAGFSHTRTTLRPHADTTTTGSATSAPSSPAASMRTGMSAAALTPTQAARLALRAVPGLVNITTENSDGGGEAGTGMVLRPDGLVLTAGHVVAGAVTLHADDLGDGQTYTATVIGIDTRHDVALIQLEDATGLRTARLSNTGIHPGDQVLSVGNAYGRGYPSIGFGPVTALGQSISNPALPGHRISGLIAANNSIAPGESGGPMLNRAGEVIGMNDAYQLTGTDHTPTGLGYAVPLRTALRAAHTLLTQTSTNPDTMM